jgi:hypothetical protein
MTDLIVAPENIPDQEIDDALAKLSAEFAGSEEPLIGEPPATPPFSTHVEDFVPPPPEAPAPVAEKPEPGVKPKRGRPTKAEKLAAKADEIARAAETINVDPAPASAVEPTRVVIETHHAEVRTPGVSNRTAAELARGRQLIESKGYRAR